jgi:hypothetical protein
LDALQDGCRREGIGSEAIGHDVVGLRDERGYSNQRLDSKAETMVSLKLRRTAEETWC